MEVSSPRVSYLPLLLPGFCLCVLSSRTFIQEHQQNQIGLFLLLLHLWIQTTAARNGCQEATQLGSLSLRTGPETLLMPLAPLRCQQALKPTI